jgi:diadenosine tetraphosphate (Ap4A) HIT family hydrolase
VDVNETMRRFGYPATLIREYPDWVVLLRPRQATLGALVLACKGEALRLSDVSLDAFAGLKQVAVDVETTLRAELDCQRLNYLMLMMVDPHVHWHVLPRYDSPRTFAGVTFTDPGWPALPDLAFATETDAAVQAALVERLRAAWPKG